MGIKLSLDFVGYIQKPDNKEVKHIKERIEIASTVETIEELANNIAQGKSFNPSEFSDDNEWKSQQIFVISINNNKDEIAKYGVMTIDKVIARSCRLGIYPMFIYDKFDSTDEVPKFNVVYMIKKSVDDIRVRNIIQIALLKIFPESDVVTKDLSAIYYGAVNGYRKFQEMNNYIDPYQLVQAMVIRINERNSNPANVTKEIERFCKTTGLNIINGYPDIRIETLDEKGKKMTSSIIYNLESDKKFPKRILMNFNIDEEEALLNIKDSENKKRVKPVSIQKNNTPIKNEIRDFKFKELFESCRLWYEFVSGKRCCENNEVYGIATNLWSIRGGQRAFTEVINENDFYIDKANKINMIKTSRAYEYSPQKCKDFCPYANDCIVYNDDIMLDNLQLKRGCIKHYAAYPCWDMDYVEKDLRESFYKALSTDDNDVHIIIAPTGIGKTAILEGIKNYSRTCIAYPNHKLGADIAERLNIENALHLKELIIKDSRVLKEYKRLVSIGANKDASQYIKDYKASLDIDRDKEEIDGINEYFQSRKELINTERPILCTHSSMVLNQSINTDTYIIDEDILLSTLIPMTPIDDKEIYDILILAKEYNSNGTVSKFLEDFYNKIVVAKGNLNEIQYIELIETDEIELDKFIKIHNDILKINLKELIHIKRIIATRDQYKAINVTGIGKRELPKKKCIILSATANIYLYRNIFPNRVFHYYGNELVATKGDLILHYNKYSRQSLQEDMEKVITDLKREAPDIKNVITYKKFKDELENNGFNVIAHFGACSGIDRYKGQDLIVLGVPHQHPSNYLLIASLITNYESRKYQMGYIRVQRSGYEFWFYTFRDNKNSKVVEILREAQFYLIESELVQAVGRARILREDAKVHLFANCPLPGAVLYNS